MEHKHVVITNGFYDFDTDITKDEWIDILTNKDIVFNYRLKLIKRWYQAYNHSSTTYEMTLKYKDISSYNSIIIELSKAILKHLNRFELFDSSDNKPTYWAILMQGRYKKKHFEWILRKEVVEAINEIGLFTKKYSLQNKKEKTIILKRKKAKMMLISQYQRSSLNRDLCLFKQNYKCEIEQQHKTFMSKNNLPYMETHHLIPIGFQSQFHNSLDIKENTVVLCSNCHNEIHYGLNNVVLIKQLFKQRKEKLLKQGIKIQLDELIKMHNK
ncbi:MAG: hypothetical protein ACRCTA_05155 [Bacilli bacterium]